jgi:hypothetical protein
MAATIMGGAGQVFADGDRMWIDLGEQNVLVPNPFVREISTSVDLYGRMETDIAIIAHGACEFHDGNLPDVKKAAEDMSIVELFRVIQRKIDERGRK